MSIVNLKIIFVKKQKQTRGWGWGLGAGGHSFESEIAVFTLETDFSRQMGYPFDNSRQIGSSS